LALNPVAIAEARRARGWTQAELAAVVRSSRSTVQCWEVGRRAPDPVYELRLTKALGLTPEPERQPVSAA
jgi:ribosome-binding protein aMBF1 (putative translation factor)